MDPLLAQIAQLAAERGFELLGVSGAQPLEDALESLSAWAEAGHGAELGYMTRNPPERADPSTLLQGVRSVVSVAVNHYGHAPAFQSEQRFGRVARYAWGRDYHDVMIPRLRELAQALEQQLGARARTAVDHSPILERAWAARAGLGFFGKNTCLLLPRRGSFYFLGEILLDVDVAPTPPAVTDHCGTCTHCLTACPTQAFPTAFVLDARRCISYLTIEHRGPIDVEFRSQLGPWVFGCDVCQDVCPFNRFASPALWPEFDPDQGVGPRLNLAETLALRSDDAFRARFAGTPLLRPRRSGILRNAAIAARNVNAAECVPALMECVTEDAEPLVRGHALWALCGLEAKTARPLAERALRQESDAFVRAEAQRVLDEVAP